MTNAEKWNDAHLVLGGSWNRVPDHPELGAGASFQGIEMTMQLFKKKCSNRDVPFDGLHDLLQTELPSLGVWFHDALRYDSSGRRLDALLDEALAVMARRKEAATTDDGPDGP